MQFKKATLSIVTLLAILSMQQASAAVSITDLGALQGATFSQGWGINNSGQVTGYSITASGIYAFLYSNGTMQSLGTLPTRLGSYGRAINDSSQVAGFAQGPYPIQAFLYSGGSMQNIGTLPNGWAAGATGINNSGQVTGWSQPYIPRFGVNHEHAFIYQNGSMTDLGSLGTGTANASAGNGINNKGDVTGWTGGGTGGVNTAVHAFIYSNGVMQDINNLAGANASYGLAINNSDQVTGWYNSPSTGQRAFLYSGGQMVGLGTLKEGQFAGQYSMGNAINSAGQVVGWSDVFIGNSNNQVQHAFIYSNGTMTDLNSLLSPNSGWDLTSAQGINDHGQITGYGTFNGQTQAFVMSGLGSVSAIPEPDEWALMLGGLGFLGFAARQRKA